MGTLANICVTIYYILATIGTLPFIFRILRRKSSSDVSLVSTFMTYIGSVCWTIYIFVTEQSLLVYIGTIWDMLVYTVYTIVVLRYHKENNKLQEDNTDGMA